MKEIWYIKLHRQILDNRLFQEKRVFSKFEAWADILLNCNYIESDFLLWYEVYKIQPWDYVTSKVKLMKKYGWGQQKLNNFFSLLEKQNMISQKTIGKSRDKASVIRVLNWGKYQTDQCTNQASNQCTTNVRPMYDQWQYKKEKKEKNNISKDIETKVSDVYWNEEINSVLHFLCKSVWVDQFKETQKWQRIYVKHIISYTEKIGKEDFIFRLKWVLQDEFKAKNCNSIKYLYNEIKAYIHSPLIQQDQKITII